VSSFFTGADAYDRFMGRYSVPLAPRFADLAGVTAGLDVLDVGCGPGALTGELIARVGTDHVTAADPSAPFVEATRDRHPGVDVRLASAESLPFTDDAFDASLAQLVVHFMTDPLAGLREMARVTRPGGVIAACVWDHAGGRGPLSPLWRVAAELDVGVIDESARPGSREGDLARLFDGAGLARIETGELTVEVVHPTFEEWWEPYELGVGPAGAYVTGMPPDRRDALREACRRSLPEPPFTIAAVAWAARAGPS